MLSLIVPTSRAQRLSSTAVYPHAGPRRQRKTRHLFEAGTADTLLQVKHMAYVIARLITLPTVAVGSAWLVARYRAIGVVASVLLGWIILYCLYHAWPAPPTEWDEDREEILFSAPIVTGMWCLLIWGFAELWSWIKRRGKGRA